MTIPSAYVCITCEPPPVVHQAAAEGYPVTFLIVLGIAMMLAGLLVLNA